MWNKSEMLYSLILSDVTNLCPHLTQTIKFKWQTSYMKAATRIPFEYFLFDRTLRLSYIQNR